MSNQNGPKKTVGCDETDKDWVVMKLIKTVGCDESEDGGCRCESLEWAEKDCGL